MLLENEAINNSSYEGYLTRDNGGKSNHQIASIDIAILYLQSQGFAVTKLMKENGSPANDIQSFNLTKPFLKR